MKWNFKKVAELYKEKGKNLIAVMVGTLGILLIGLSSCGNEEKTNPTISEEINNDDEYCNNLEEKIADIVMAITGDDNCLVAITLETGTEYVYADQNKTDTDQTEDKSGTETTKKESIKKEQEYIIVKGEDGSQQAIKITEKKPVVRGVAIVTYEITDAAKEEVMQAVTSVLGITSRKISITSKAVVK